MKKLCMLICAMVVLVLTPALALAGTIRVESDKNYTVNLKCSGSSKTIKIGRGTTTVTFHSSSSSCDIVGGQVKWPVKKLTNNGKWKIRSGVAKKN